MKCFTNTRSLCNYVFYSDFYYFNAFVSVSDAYLISLYNIFFLGSINALLLLQGHVLF